MWLRACVHQTVGYSTESWAAQASSSGLGPEGSTGALHGWLLQHRTDVATVLLAHKDHCKTAEPFVREHQSNQKTFFPQAGEHRGTQLPSPGNRRIDKDALLWHIRPQFCCKTRQQSQSELILTQCSSLTVISRKNLSEDRNTVTVHGQICNQSVSYDSCNTA